MNNDELIYACALNRIFKNAPSIANEIILNLGYPSAIFNLSTNDLKEIMGAGSRYVDKISNRKYIDEAYKECEWAYKKGIRILYIKDENYPYRLRECTDPPIILFTKGPSDLNTGKTIAIVGTRKPSQYGIDLCNQSVEYLAQTDQKPLIVSGLAYGIDITAHNCAIKHKLETVAVMATGIDDIYPTSHRAIARQIESTGALVSEFPLNSTPFPQNFLQRNRVIAGLVDAVIIIESDVKGGAMVTARLGNAYNREVFAYPGRSTDRTSRGCNHLIGNNQAQLISEAREIGNFLDLTISQTLFPSRSDNIPDLNRVKVKIIELLKKEGSLSFDQLLRSDTSDIGSLNLNLMELEISGIIKNSGNCFTLVKVY